MTYGKPRSTIVLIFVNGRLVALEWKAGEVFPGIGGAPRSYLRLFASAADLGDISSSSGVTDIFGEGFMADIARGLVAATADELTDPVDLENSGDILE